MMYGRHEMPVAEAETVGKVEGNMNGPAKRGAVALPRSKTPSRSKGSRWKLGDLTSDRRGVLPAARIGKARSRSQMMHGREKSDPAIVAMKPSNEAGVPVEETVERRAGATGNADHHHTLRTQGRASVDQELDRIRYDTIR